MKVEPIGSINTKHYNLDGSEIYDVKTGKTVADIEFGEVLKKILEEEKSCVK